MASPWSITRACINLLPWRWLKEPLWVMEIKPANRLTTTPTMAMMPRIRKVTDMTVKLDRRWRLGQGDGTPRSPAYSAGRGGGAGTNGSGLPPTAGTACSTRSAKPIGLGEPLCRIG